MISHETSQDKEQKGRTGLTGKMMKLFLDMLNLRYSSVTWVVMSSSHWQIDQENRSGLETDLGIVGRLITSPRENIRVGRENK